MPARVGACTRGSGRLQRRTFDTAVGSIKRKIGQIGVRGIRAPQFLFGGLREPITAAHRARRYPTSAGRVMARSRPRATGPRAIRHSHTSAAGLPPVCSIATRRTGDRMTTAVSKDMNPTRDDFAALLAETMRARRVLRGQRRQGQRSSPSRRTSRHRRRPEDGRPRAAEGVRRARQAGRAQGRRHRRGLSRARRERAR